MQSRIARIALVVLAAVVGCFFAIEAWIAAGVGARCGTTCNETEHWYDDPEAWEWTGQAVLVTVSAGLLVIGTRLALAGRTRLAGCLLVTAVAVFVGWWAVVVPNVSLG